MGLEEYQAKRSFSQTPEPKGRREKEAEVLRFVVQKHRASRLHYDFRLELGGVLKSWAVPKGPSLNPADKRLAMMVEDHPFNYRSFEGVIPAGNYGAGEVIVWDEGTYEPYLKEEGRDSLYTGLNKGDLKFILHGHKLKGAFALVKTKREPNSWLLIKKQDEHATEQDVLEQNQSVLSGRQVEDLRDPSPLGLNKISPRFIKPMLTTLAAGVEDRAGWLYEIKWDGYRIIAVLDGRQAQLFSRNQQAYTDKFAPVAAALEKIKKSCVLDGEVVVLDERGRSRFQLLQNFQTSGQGDLVYYVFDLLHLEGYDTLELTLAQRRELLAKLLPKEGIIRLSEAVEGKGKALYVSALKEELEGIIGKDPASTYRAGVRTQSWLKYKTKQRQEAVICGYTDPKGSRKLIGSLVLGVYRQKELIYIGHSGGGFTQKNIKDLHQKLSALEIKQPPIQPVPKTNAPVHWVKPELVCEVEFAEWTQEGLMRQPIYLGLREDKHPAEVSQEEVIPSSTKLETTHLDKVYWPKEGYTKGQLLQYYRDVSAYMLPYLLDRPHSLNRHPNGIEAESFYQKDVAGKVPSWVKTFSVKSDSEKRVVNYLVCDSPDALLYMANLGCIEINPWLSRTLSPDRPDYCVIDLDPEDIAFEYVVEAAQKVHQVLDEIGVAHYCKTSGATGLHIYIPLGGKYTYEQSKQFAQIVAQLVNAGLPKTTSLERSPSKRQKRVYLDYLQNRRGQTLAAAYSVRPRPGAPVSTPLLWEEVASGLNPIEFTIFTTLQRLADKGDLWRPLLTEAIDLKSALTKLAT